jgi:hypothetical protein
MSDYTAVQRFEALASIAESACDSAARQYDDYYKSFAALDGKAQSTATLGSAVLAAVVAVMNGGRLSGFLSNDHPCRYLLVTAPAVGALLTVIVGFYATRVTEITVPFAADEQIEEVEDLVRLPADELSKGHVLNYHRARLTHWKEALSGMSSAVSTKAKWVLCGHVLLVITLFLLLALFVTLVNHVAG